MARAERGGGGHQPQAAAAMRVTESGRADGAASRTVSKRDVYTTTQDRGARRKRHNECRDSHHEAASSTAAPRDDSQDAGRRSKRWRGCARRSSRRDRRPNGDAAQRADRSTSRRAHGAVATWIAPSNRPTTPPAPPRSDLSNNRITHDEAAVPPPVPHVATRAACAVGHRRRTLVTTTTSTGGTQRPLPRRGGGGTYRKGGEATATTEGGAPRRRRPWMIGRAWRRRPGERGTPPRRHTPSVPPPRPSPDSQPASPRRVAFLLPPLPPPLTYLPPTRREHLDGAPDGQGGGRPPRRPPVTPPPTHRRAALRGRSPPPVFFWHAGWLLRSLWPEYRPPPASRSCGHWGAPAGVGAQVAAGASPVGWPQARAAKEGRGQPRRWGEQARRRLPPLPPCPSHVARVELRTPPGAWVAWRVGRASPQRLGTAKGETAAKGRRAGTGGGHPSEAEQQRGAERRGAAAASSHPRRSSRAPHAAGWVSRRPSMPPAAPSRGATSTTLRAASVVVEPLHVFLSGRSPAPPPPAPLTLALPAACSPSRGAHRRRHLPARATASPRGRRCHPHGSGRRAGCGGGREERGRAALDADEPARDGDAPAGRPTDHRGRTRAWQVRTRPWSLTCASTADRRHHRRRLFSAAPGAADAVAAVHPSPVSHFFVRALKLFEGLAVLRSNSRSFVTKQTRCGNPDVSPSAAASALAAGAQGDAAQYEERQRSAHCDQRGAAPLQRPSGGKTCSGTWGHRHRGNGSRSGGCGRLLPT